MKYFSIMFYNGYDLKDVICLLFCDVVNEKIGCVYDDNGDEEVFDYYK